MNGKVHLTVCIPCARCLEPTASGLDIQFENELDVNDEDYIKDLCHSGVKVCRSATAGSMIQILSTGAAQTFTVLPAKYSFRPDKQCLIMN